MKYCKAIFVILVLLFVSRLNAADGELDPDFGWVPAMKVVPVVDGTNLIERPTSMARFSDGRIVVAGEAWPNSSAYCSAVICVDSNAVLDSSFGSNGVVILNFGLTGGSLGGNNLHWAADVGIQDFGNGDERVVLAGEEYSTDNGFPSLFALRLNKDGSLDDGGPDDSTPGDSFGTNGVFIYDENPAPDSSSHEVYDLAIDSNNVIAIAGGNNDEPTVVMLDTNGLPLASFGSNGAVTVSMGYGGVDSFFDAAFAPNGDLLLAGGPGYPENLPFAVVRMDRTGALVAGFGSNGIARISNTVGTAQQLVLDDNDLYVAGAKDANLAFCKLDATTGVINTNFGANGVAEIEPGTKDIFANDLFADGRGGFVCGALYDNKTRFCFTRITTNGLDTTYGTNGAVIITGNTLLTSYQEKPMAILPEDDGRFFVTGANTFNDSYGDFAFMRIDTNGFIDRSLVQFNPDSDHIMEEDLLAATCVDIDSQGRIITGGGNDVASEYMYIARYLSDGKPDLTFATDMKADRFVELGKQIIATTPRHPLYDVLFTSNAVYVCGGVRSIPSGKSFICKLTPDGALDTSFGTNDTDGVDGFLTLLISDPTIPQSVEGFYCLTELSDGRIATAGGAFYTNNPSFPGPSVVVFYPDGTLDTSFASNGVYRFPYIPTNSSEPTSMSEDRQGRILITSSGFLTERQSSILIFRLTPNGVLDTDFGNNDGDGVDGAIEYTIDEYRDNISAIRQRHGSNMRIVASCYGSQWIARLTSGGMPDFSFACGAGKEKLEELPGDLGDVNIAIMPDGKLIVAPSIYDTNAGMVTRLSRNGLPDPSFATNNVPFSINDITVDPVSGDVIAVGGSDTKSYLTRIQNSLQPTLDGTFGKGISFNGVDDYIFFNASNSPSFSGSNDYTVAFWVNPTSYGVPYRLESAATDSYRDSIRINSDRQIAFRVIRAGFGYTTLTTSDTIPWNEWSHIACVKEGGEIRIYINGQFSKGKTFTAGIADATPSDGGLYLGKRGTANDAYFPGTIDNFYIANKALTAQEIQAWMYRDMETSCSFYTNLVLSLNFNTPGTNITSCAGAMRVGTFYNMDASAFIDSDILHSFRTWAGNTLNGVLIANDCQGSSSNGLDWNLNFQIVSNGPLGTVTVYTGNSFTFTPTAYETGTNNFSYRFVDFDGKTSDPVQISIVIPDNWDNDAIPDSWEAAHGLDPTNAADATANPDSDPFNNTEEYIADTDPTNGASYFRITAISNNSPVKVYFNSSSNRLYTMLGCTNLIDASWTNVPGAGPEMGAGGADSMQDTNEPAKGPFYRLKVRLP